MPVTDEETAGSGDQELDRGQPTTEANWYKPSPCLRYPKPIQRMRSSGSGQVQLPTSNGRTRSASS